MSTGRYGAYSLVANTAQSLTQGTTVGPKICSVNMVNRGNFAVRVSIAISTTVNSISNLDYIDRDIELLSKGVIERTGIAITQGQFITVSADTVGVSATCWGADSGEAVDPVPTAIPTA